MKRASAVGALALGALALMGCDRLGRYQVVTNGPTCTTELVTSGYGTVSTVTKNCVGMNGWAVRPIQVCNGVMQVGGWIYTENTGSSLTPMCRADLRSGSGSDAVRI